MPHPKDILDSMYGEAYYSFLDGASAYWAIEMTNRTNTGQLSLHLKGCLNSTGCRLD